MQIVSGAPFVTSSRVSFAYLWPSTRPAGPASLDVALEHRAAEWLDGEWVPAPEQWDS